MSYCRNDGWTSDVYVIRSATNSKLICYCCLEGNEQSTEAGMIAHLQEHRRLGHRVPERAFRRLEAERDGLPYKTDVEQALEEFKSLHPKDWAATRPDDDPL